MSKKDRTAEVYTEDAIKDIAEKSIGVPLTSEPALVCTVYLIEETRTPVQHPHESISTLTRGFSTREKACAYIESTGAKPFKYGYILETPIEDIVYSILVMGVE